MMINKKLSSQKGSALLGAIVLLIALGYVGASLYSLQNSSSTIAIHDLQNQQALAIGTGGIERALYLLKHGQSPDVSDLQFDTGNLNVESLPGSTVKVTSQVGDSVKTQLINANYTSDCVELDTDHSQLFWDTESDLLNQIIATHFRMSCSDQFAEAVDVVATWNWSACALAVDCSEQKYADDGTPRNCDADLDGLRADLDACSVDDGGAKVYRVDFMDGTIEYVYDQPPGLAWGETIDVSNWTLDPSESIHMLTKLVFDEHPVEGGWYTIDVGFADGSRLSRTFKGYRAGTAAVSSGVAGGASGSGGSGGSSGGTGTAGTGGGDKTAPTTPGNFRPTGKTDNMISLAWDAATDNVGVGEYWIYRDGVKISNTAGLNFNDAGLIGNTTYRYKILAVDAAGNQSPLSAELAVTTNVGMVMPAGDTQPPTAPSNLKVTGKSDNMVSLSWDASTDNDKINDYWIYRDGVKVGNTNMLNTNDGGLVSNTTYHYQVRALDPAGNQSPLSNEVVVTTNAPGGNPPPGGNQQPGARQADGFTLQSGEVFVQTNKKMALKVIGSAITCGANGPAVDVRVDLGVDNVFSTLFNNNDVNGGEEYSVVTPFDSLKKFTVRSRASLASCNNFNATIMSNNTLQVKSLLNGDQPPAMNGWGGQQNVQGFLMPYLDQTGKIKLGTNQVIMLFEIGTDLSTNQNAPGADFQDLVVIMSITNP